MFKVGSCDMHVDYCSQVRYLYFCNTIGIGVMGIDVDGDAHC